jgi:DNA polymerase-3 subunit alpha
MYTNRMAVARRYGKVIDIKIILKPEGFNIPYDAERIHGISTELAEADGISLAEVRNSISH